MDEPSEKILEHFQNPKNVGIIENADGYARVENPFSGDLTDIYIKVEAGRITDAKFKSFGCVVTVASASALSETIKGMEIDEIVNDSNPVEMLLGLIMNDLEHVPKKNMHCVPAAIHTLLEAIANYFRKNKEDDKLKNIEIAIEEVKKQYKRWEKQNSD